MDYTRIDDGMEAVKSAGKGEVVFRAQEIRKERTGVHAKVTLGTQGVPLAVDTFNVTRDPDRVKLANKFRDRLAAKFDKAALTALDEAYPKVELELDLMVFCDGLWDAFIGDESGGRVEGDENPSAPPWVIPGLVLEGSTMIWHGAAGDGKSTLMRLAAQSLQHGVGEVIPIRHQAPVVYVDAEEPPDERRRQLGNINGALMLDRTASMYIVDARALSITDLAPRLERAVRETGAEHVFIDSLSRMAGGMNLNDNATATLLIDSLSAIPASITWVGHSGHEHADRMAGSRHFTNAARLMVAVDSRISDHGRNPELTRGIRARIKKGNGTVPTETLYWTLEYHPQYGLQAAKMATPEEWPALYCDYEMENRDCGRRTWTGQTRYGVRCKRHEQDEEE